MAAAPALVVAAGSTNPTKTGAARDAYARCFPGAPVAVLGFDVPSGVSDQPMTDEETRTGAFNRALAAAAAYAAAHGGRACDFAVGLEGGCLWEDVRLPTAGAPAPAAATRTLLCYAYMAVLQPATGRWGYARTGSFSLPPPVAALVWRGMELGHADDAVFGRSDSKRSNGAVGLLTGDLITRTTYYEHALVLALVPFLPGNEQYYHTGEGGGEANDGGTREAPPPAASS
jgi:inosine/xanthosine triphosphatase